MRQEPLLSVNDLSVSFLTPRGELEVVDSVSFELYPGQVLGVVGESGSGKSVTNLAIMSLLPQNAEAQVSSILLEGREISQLSAREKRKIFGKEIAMIFQDPMSSLNPCFSVAFQLKESLKVHQQGMSSRELQEQSVELLKQVGISSPERCLLSYPHQLSGGIAQRVMIAMAISGRPKLLIADEPTTALDVTVQAQILKLLKDLGRQREMAMILVTHDIGVVAEQADRIMVMYAGQVVEVGDVDDVLYAPMHPYTEALLKAVPQLQMKSPFRTPLPTIPGMVPSLMKKPEGCRLYGRCQRQEERCQKQEPPLIEKNQRYVKCFKPKMEG